MPYHIKAEEITLDGLKARIIETDLVPSRKMLLDDIDENFSKLERSGLKTMADFRKAAKTKKSTDALYKQTAIGVEYLTLLRREVESYFPKAFPLSDFTWLDPEGIAQLIESGYKNTALLFEAIEASGKDAVLKAARTEPAFAAELHSLVCLTRIQWVSPLTAKMLFEAGYPDVKSIAEADAEKLSATIDAVNTANKYFKGKIGLRDVNRLVKSAGYISQ